VIRYRYTQIERYTRIELEADCGAGCGGDVASSATGSAWATIGYAAMSCALLAGKVLLWCVRWLCVWIAAMTVALARLLVAFSASVTRPVRRRIAAAWTQAEANALRRLSTGSEIGARPMLPPPAYRCVAVIVVPQRSEVLKLSNR
jgi:hypothetical protein